MLVGDVAKESALGAHDGLTSPLILDNRDNRGQIATIDYLVWSLVAAELRNVDEEHARFAERMREDASFNLRQLPTM